MIAPREEMPVFQSNFYRNSYYRFLRLIVIEMVIALILFVAIAYNIFFERSRTYFVTTTNGLIIPLTGGRIVTPMGHA